MANTKAPQRQSGEMQGEITEDGIERMRARINVLIPQPVPHNTEAHVDTIRHFAHGYGEDNPLYTDAAYAAGTRWGGVIAPPMYLSTMGITRVREIPKDVRARGAGALRGIPNYLSGSSWEWFRPVYPGDTIYLNYFIYDVEEKRSEFGGGRAVVVHHRREYTNSARELVAVNTTYFFHVEREATQRAGKYANVPAPEYTDAELDAIDAAYEAEFRRGGETLYWEDVSVGDELPPMVRGPLCVTDIISNHVGIGWGVFGVAPLRMGYQNRKRIPAFYTRNEFGAWDAAQRVHWEERRARSVGNPRPYDYGRMRTTWVTQYCTNWAGDDAWLWKESDEIRKFNYMGDVTWIRGKVTDCWIADEGCAVALDIWGTNQRDEVTVPAKATMLLPSREHGPVKLPGQAPGAVSTTSGLIGFDG